MLQGVDVNRELKNVVSKVSACKCANYKGREFT